MKSPRISPVLLAIVTLSVNHQHAVAQFTWDGDCGFNWADCCNFGTPENPDWHNNWTIAASPTACPNLPGAEDHVYASTTVMLAQPYQTWVKSLTVTGTFMLLSELDVTDFVTINGTITEPTTLQMQNGPGYTLELHGENATATISSFATLDFAFDGSISGGPGAMLYNNGLITKMVGGKNPPPYESLSALNIPWENNGTISAWDGKLVLQQGGTNNGIIESHGEAEVRFQGPANFVLDGEVRGDGLIRFLSTFSGGSTNVIGNYHPTNTLIAGGYATVNFAVDTDIENLTIGNAGIIGGEADLTIDDLVWNGGYSLMAPGGTTIVEDTALFEYDTFAGGGITLQRELALHGESIFGTSIGLGMDNAELRNHGDVQMHGNSTITQGCCTPNSIIRNFGAWRKTSGAPSVINATFFNFGDIAVESGTLHFDGDMSSQAPITVNPGGVLVLGHKQQSTHLGGSITGEGTVWFYSDFADASIDDVGGTYDVGTTTIQGALVNFPSDAITATLNMIGGTGASKLLGDGDFTVTDQLNWSFGEMAGAGTTIVLGPMALTGGVSLDRTLELNATAPPAKYPPTWTMYIKPLGTLRGNDVTVDSYVNNSGVVSPGGAGEPREPIGYIHFTGGYTQNSDGNLVIERGGVAGHDQLLVDGLATLGGTLTASGFPTSGGQSFTILTAADVQGTFAQANVPSGMTVTYTNTSVILQSAPGAPCPADINDSGAVDVDDLIAVILGWGDCADCATCAADTDGSCAVDVDDLIAVILAWGTCS